MAKNKHSMRETRKFVQRWGATFFLFFSFLVNESIQISLKSGHHRTSIAKKPYIFVIFQGGKSGPPVPPPPPLDMYLSRQKKLTWFGQIFTDYCFWAFRFWPKFYWLPIFWVYRFQRYPIETLMYSISRITFLLKPTLVLYKKNIVCNIM